MTTSSPLGTPLKKKECKDLSDRNLFLLNTKWALFLETSNEFSFKKAPLKILKD